MDARPQSDPVHAWPVPGGRLPLAQKIAYCLGSLAAVRRITNPATQPAPTIPRGGRGGNGREHRGPEEKAAGAGMLRMRPSRNPPAGYGYTYAPFLASNFTVGTPSGKKAASISPMGPAYVATRMVPQVAWSPVM